MINMVVEEDDGPCKVILAAGLCSIFSLSFICWSWHRGNVKYTRHLKEQISSAASLADIGDEAMKDRRANTCKKEETKILI